MNSQSGFATPGIETPPSSDALWAAPLLKSPTSTVYGTPQQELGSLSPSLRLTSPTLPFLSPPLMAESSSESLFSLPDTPPTATDHAQDLEDVEEIDIDADTEPPDETEQLGSPGHDEEAGEVRLMGTDSEADDHDEVQEGLKDFQPDGSQRQAKLLEAVMGSLETHLTAERIASRRRVVSAHYHPETGLTSVPKPTGSAFGAMGRYYRGTLHLLPEEALFMLERGYLDVRWATDPAAQYRRIATFGTIGPDIGALLDSAPMSVEEAHAAMIHGGADLSLPKYQVFAALKKLGYIVNRHRPAVQDEYMAPPSSPKRSVLGKWLGSLLCPASWLRGLARCVAGLWRRVCSIYQPVTALYPVLTPLAFPGGLRPLSSFHALTSLALIHRSLQIVPPRHLDSTQSLAIPPELAASTSREAPLTGPSVASDKDTHDALTLMTHRLPLEFPRLPRESSPFPDFDVYRPCSTYSKRNPGTPDFRVKVVNMNGPAPPAWLLDLISGSKKERVARVPATTRGHARGLAAPRARERHKGLVKVAVSHGGQLSFLGLGGLERISHLA